MLRSLLLLLCIVGTLGLTGQDIDTQAKISVKAHYGIRGHHLEEGLFHGVGLRVGVHLDESWTLLLQHDRYAYTPTEVRVRAAASAGSLLSRYLSDGRLRVVSAGARRSISAPRNPVQLFLEGKLAVLSHQGALGRKFNTGWGLEAGLGASTNLTKSLFLEAQVVNSLGRIYGERASTGDIITGNDSAGFNVFSLQLGLGFQF